MAGGGVAADGVVAAGGVAVGNVDGADGVVGGVGAAGVVVGGGVAVGRVDGAAGVVVGKVVGVATCPCALARNCVKLRPTKKKAHNIVAISVEMRIGRKYLVLLYLIKEGVIQF